MFRIFILSLLFTSLVIAQGQNQNNEQNSEQKTQMPQVDMFPDMLERLVKTMIEIDELNIQMQKKITQATEELTKEMILDVRSEFKVQALQIIFENGLSMHEYKNYTKRLSMDKEFKEKIFTLIKEKKEASKKN